MKMSEQKVFDFVDEVGNPYERDGNPVDVKPDEFEGLGKLKNEKLEEEEEGPEEEEEEEEEQEEEEEEEENEEEIEEEETEEKQQPEKSAEEVLREQVALLSERLAELEQTRTSFGEEEETDDPDLEITEEDVNNLLSGEKEGIKAFAKKIAEYKESKTIRALKRQAEATLKNIAAIIQVQTSQASLRQRYAEIFLKRNPELVQHGQFCSFIAAEIKRKNPNISIQDLYQQTEVEARKRLGLKPVSKVKGGQRVQQKGLKMPPAMPGTRSKPVLRKGRRSKQDEIDELDRELLDLGG